jgi:hypothetical protein
LPPLLEADNIRIELGGKVLGRILPVKRTNILAALLIAVSLMSTGCGTSDYVQSIELTATSASVGGGLYNLPGWGATLQLQVNAVYHSGKTVPVTNAVTYAVTPQNNNDLGAALLPPPNTVTINTTGMMTAVNPTECTWENLGTATAPSWVLTGSYQVIATYKGMQSQPVFVGVASAAGNNSTGACGPAAAA